MSDEASSSAAAEPGDNANDERHHPEAPGAAQLAERKKKNRQMFNRKRGELLDVELRNVDILVYAELSAIYYMDCSFLRFLLRAFVHFVFLTPKPSIFPEPPGNRPYVGAILGANLLCLFLHAIYAAPAAGEATRGYLHGGLAMDFIGQKGPTSKTALLLLDVLVVMLQLGQLSMHITRQRLKDTAVAVTTSNGREYTASAPVQDLDSEERGVRRSDEQQDIEMQTLDRSGVAAAAPTTNSEDQEDETTERDTLLSTTATAPRPNNNTDSHIFDAFNSGQIVLADLDIAKTIKEQFWAYQMAPPEDSTHSTRDMRANITGQLLRWRFGAAATVGRPAQSV
ncbi:hypothetical protein LTR36_003144 [Oleoguttula mirabilis]|uniref:DUF1746 domain-containing protein n=1 Tax=Oleoguttula mirabilis TaxID=1507867 RepID=A0AAV9JWQ5_9PEZI|nr:hypothetical protein LTR36_003144 [Oleoguttula mirabilis]